LPKLEAKIWVVTTGTALARALRVTLIGQATAQPPNSGLQQTPPSRSLGRRS
jgi:hypothetical protein